MNTKTTLALAFCLVVGIGTLLFVRSRQAGVVPAISPTQPSDTTAKKVTEDDLGDVVKITVAKEGAEPLAFEKRKENEAAPQAVWHITAPFEAKATTWEIDRLPRDLGQLTYEISYSPGEAGGVTLEQAGLAPPRAVVTLTNADGKDLKLEVGKPASQNETYVRLAGREPILVVKSNVANLIKKEAIEYRDPSVWSFEPADVKRVEITDRSGDSPTDYVFVRDDGRWMMESPVTARATDKVEEALKTVAKLRVLKWDPQAQGRLNVLGLDPAAMTARFTVEEKIPIEKKVEEETEPTEETGEPSQPAETQTRTTVHTLHLSNLSPIGEDTKTYVRVGDQPAVATVMKTIADKLKPVMNEWREMRLITDDVARANRIELSVGDESATLSKVSEGWRFEDSGASADEEEINKLLESIKKLQAVVLLEPGEGQLSEYGLDTPRALITLTIPGVESARRVTVGGYTDQQTKKMVYVGRGDAGSVAKVMEADVAPLLRGPSVYHDRSVLDVPPDQLRRFAIARENPFTKERENIVLEATDGVWRMTAPAAADARQEQSQILVDIVAALQAERIVPRAEVAEIAKHVQEPDVLLSITHQPPAEPAATDDQAAADEAAESAEPPVVVRTLAVAQHGDKLYGKLADQPLIYELPGSVLDKLTAEFRGGKALQFKPEEVTRFSIRQSGSTHAFVRRDERWVYETEPDLPLDRSKVENLLVQLQDLQAERFAAPTSSGTDSFGLSNPESELRVMLGNGKELALMISAMSSPVATSPGRFASSSELPGIFVLSDATLQRISVDLDALSAS